MSSLVLDNSISAAWCFEDQSTAYTEAVLQAIIDGVEAIVPAIWKLEVANALAVAERRKKIVPEKSPKFIRDLQQFTISVDLVGLDYVFDAVLEHARIYQRSVEAFRWQQKTNRSGRPQKHSA